jgi:hypothetical protein
MKFVQSWRENMFPIHIDTVQYIASTVNPHSAQDDLVPIRSFAMDSKTPQVAYVDVVRGRVWNRCMQYIAVSYSTWEDALTTRSMMTKMTSKVIAIGAVHTRASTPIVPLFFFAMQ